MAVRVQHPSGAVVEFPDGTDNDTITKAMRSFDGPQQQQQPQAPQQDVSTAGDVVSSFGAGLARGAAGIGGLAGNLESLGRAGINKAASMFGADGPVVSPDPGFPTSGEVLDAGEQIFNSKVYEPQTTAGKYARTVGEFAPAVLFPASRTSSLGKASEKTANVVVPAVASEAAGQATEGTWAEPWARAGAAVMGSALPGMAAKAVTPFAATPQHTAAVRTLQDEGVTALTAGQRTNSKPLKWAESVTQDIPFAGRRAATIQERQAEQFTQAALKRAGVTDAKRATPEVIDGAFERLGQNFDDIAKRNDVLFNDDLVKKLDGVVNEYLGFVPRTQAAPLVEDTFNTLVNSAKHFGYAPGKPLMASGELIASVRSRLSRKAQQTTDPELKAALSQMRDVLDDAVEKSAILNGNKADATLLKQTRQQYAALNRIVDAASGAGEAAANGLISPAMLSAAAKKQNRRGYARGKSELGNLGRAGEAVMKPLPNSGTAPRAAAMNSMNVLFALAGNVVGGLPGAVAAVAAPAAIGRSLMSEPVQMYLGNQLAAPLVNALEAARLPMRNYLPQGAMYLNEQN